MKLEDLSLNDAVELIAPDIKGIKGYIYKIRPKTTGHPLEVKVTKKNSFSSYKVGDKVSCSVDEIKLLNFATNTISNSNSVAKRILALQA